MADNAPMHGPRPRIVPAAFLRRQVFAAMKVAQRRQTRSLVTATWLAWGLALGCAHAAASTERASMPSPPVSPLQDSIAQRVDACITCHGADGRAGPDGYYP